MSKNDYYVVFKGIRLDRNKANRIGLALILGFVAMPIGLFLEKVVFKLPIGLFIVLIFALFGYFTMAPFLFKNKK